jgi:hypothetical protein
MLAMLIGCGLRRGELLALTLESVQQREEHWVIADLVGKAGHVRTVPIPSWVKSAIDAWTSAADITEGRVFRAINKAGRIWGNGMSAKVLWDVVRVAAARAGIEKLAPLDLRRTCARLCHLAGSEQFLLGHVSVQTTGRDLGCKQKLRCAVDDRLGIEPAQSWHDSPVARAGTETTAALGDFWGPIEKALPRAVDYSYTQRTFCYKVTHDPGTRRRLPLFTPVWEW